MTIWYQALPVSTKELIKPVDVLRETKDFLWINDTYMGRTRERRLAKAQGAWHGSYFPTKAKALFALRETELNRMERLEREYKSSKARLARVTDALNLAYREESGETPCQP